MNGQKQKEEYVVRLYRKDGAIFDTFKSTSFKDCKAEWKRIVDQWQKCHKELEVFVLEKPILTAFEPGAVYEILLIPFVDEIANVDDDNPYKMQMQKQGLLNTLQGNKVYSDVLDAGRL